MLTRTELIRNFDSTLVFACFPVSLCCFLFLIYTHFKFPQLRAHPNGLMVMVGVAAFLLSCSYLASSIYYRANHSLIPQGFKGFCQTMAFFNIVGSYSIYLYNGLYYLLFILQARNTTLQRPQHSALLVHAAVLLALSVILTVAFSTGRVGLTIYGVCSLQATIVTPLFEVAMIVFFFGLSLASIFVVGKLLPSVSELLPVRRQVMRYNACYLAFFAVVFTTLIVSKVTTTAKCQQASYRHIGLFITLGNLTVFAMLLILFVLRVLHPVVWTHYFGTRRTPPVHDVEMAILSAPQSNWMEELAAKYTWEFRNTLLNAVRVISCEECVRNFPDDIFLYVEMNHFLLT